MPTASDGDELILGLSLSIKAFQFRPRRKRQFLCLIETVLDRRHGDILNQRPLRQYPHAHGVSKVAQAILTAFWAVIRSASAQI